MSSSLNQRLPTPRRPRHPVGATTNPRWRHLCSAGLALALAEGGDMEQAMVACEVGLDDGFNPPRVHVSLSTARPMPVAQDDALVDDDDIDPPTPSPTPELPQ